MTKQTDVLDALDKLHKAYKKNEFVTMAITFLTNEEVGKFHNDIWEGCHFIMVETGEDIKDALTVLGKE